MEVDEIVDMLGSDQLVSLGLNLVCVVNLTLWTFLIPNCVSILLVSSCIFNSTFFNFAFASSYQYYVYI